uniref:Threonylcarbamoyladenosine tRNA methylthiotransferase n=1 Tax=Percolomonas cosmopolitus TaxID=63605 RepID=A0A7S1PI37_9EUKA|eukprot:CAMPEP_0117442540 /NCGR_PEP_ID=MMETSP0759-20121206/4206_1 /TAXON_ID=63605 /ORGANISM="Percolomonas cosmopolitus, Strain WS" /LENGTH=684 /DNA_ID=CAMNT_0005234435 /DNA_START=341 /DNA_END=2395 /DNA_ORIENTATION=-
MTSHSGNTHTDPIMKNFAGMTLIANADDTDDIEDLNLDHLISSGRHVNDSTRKSKKEPYLATHTHDGNSDDEAGGTSSSKTLSAAALRRQERRRKKLEALRTEEEKKAALENENAVASDDLMSSKHNHEDSENDEDQPLDDGLALLPRTTSKRAQKERKDIEGYENIPGLQTVYLKTYGCSHNQSDSEYMAGLLAESGYAITDDFDDADIYLLNSCTVKNPSQDTMTNLMDKAHSTGKPVVISGCVPQGEKKNKLWQDVSLIGVQQIQHVKYVVEESLKGNKVHMLSRKKDNKPSLALPKVRHNPYIEIIPVNVGCLNQCTYCKTKHARGDLASWSVEEIAERVKKVVAEGVKEIRLTSEDTGAYGIDIGSNISKLLNTLVDLLPDGVMMRVGMTNPPYIKNHLEDVAKILNHPNVYSFLHIPVQAGNDKVLYDMKREYTVADFRAIVDYLREHVPHISLCTDIICGFPTETEEDYEETLALCDEYKFEALNISQFYPRPGTPAARMKRVPTQDVKNRSRALTKIYKSYFPYEYLKGTKQRVWITEVARDGHHLAGHTKCYVQCLVDPSEAEMGTDVWVHITETDKFFVKGKVVPKPSEEEQREHAKKTAVAPVNVTPEAFSSRGDSAKEASASTDLKPSEKDSNKKTARKKTSKKHTEAQINWAQFLFVLVVVAAVLFMFLRT